jgi:GDP-D-mannose dehydratase
MKNLVIGSTSQLSHYFPDDFIKISSRNLDFSYLQSDDWDGVYITFAEQRIYDRDVDYISVNYVQTLNVIDAVLERCNKVVCYTSCELWNDLSGFITPNTPPQFMPLSNEYTISKLLLLNKVIERRKSNQLYNKVVLAHPFYFNSIHRTKYFLFGKIFDSILNRKQITVGDLDFYRDMVHTRFVVEQSIAATKDVVIGAGRLFNVRDFVRDLYTANDLEYDNFVRETPSDLPSKQKLIMARVGWDYPYSRLLRDTQNEIEIATWTR